ncbi:MAG: hypothetical protein NW226_27110 [Microscillaceae bacterium]|nr:hypothetical protein [Microscillaceae bacterium]
MAREALAVRLDFFALCMFLGIIQGLFLAFFFLSGSRRQVLSNRFLGAVLLSNSLIVLEIFLCYTHYMFQVLYLIDFSECLNFTLGPLFYLYIRTKIRSVGMIYIHFLPAVFWLLYSLGWQIQSLDFKYNAYLNAYHPQLDLIPIREVLPSDILGIRKYIIHFTLGSLFVYVSLSASEVFWAYQKAQLKFWSRASPDLVWLRGVVLQLWLMMITVLEVVGDFQN